jgi:hypothetical protein
MDPIAKGKGENINWQSYTFDIKMGLMVFCELCIPDTRIAHIFTERGLFLL